MIHIFLVVSAKAMGSLKLISYQKMILIMHSQFEDGAVPVCAR